MQLIVNNKGFKSGWRQPPPPPPPPPSLNRNNRTPPAWGEEESARADFNLREHPCFLNNTYEILSLLLKLIGEQDLVTFFVKGITCSHGNPIFDATFSPILTFLILFLLAISSKLLLIICLKVKELIISLSLLTFQVNCDVIGIAQYLF